MIDQDVPDDMQQELLDQVLEQAAAAPAPELVKIEDERPREVERLRRVLRAAERRRAAS
jgi:hypothetical protein